MAAEAEPTDWHVIAGLVWLSVLCSEACEEVLGCSMMSNPDIGFALVRALVEPLIPTKGFEQAMCNLG